MSNEDHSGFNQWKKTDEPFSREPGPLPDFVRSETVQPGTPDYLAKQDPEDEHCAAIRILSTTPTLEGHPIQHYLGVVSGEAGVGSGLGTTVGQSFDSLLGTRSTGTEGRLIDARTMAFRELCHRAGKMGANAVVGITIDQEATSNGSLILVTVTGTAVVI